MTRVWRAAGSTVRWLLLLGLALVPVLVASGPARADSPTSTTGVTPTSLPTDPTTSIPTATTDPGSTTTTTAPAGGGPYQARFVPCGTTTGACSATPAQVAVSYPAGQPVPPVTLEWVKGSAPGAPQPASATAALDPAAAVDCQGAKPAAGQAETCWAWPTGLQDKSTILNGTYRVTAGSQKPVTVGLAVAPAPPRQVVATATNQSVRISWQPSAAPEADLVGYTVTRNGQAVYSCTLDGLGPGSAIPCPSPLAVTDNPAAGTWTYAVTSVRLGVDDAGGDSVGSAPAGAAPGPVTVAAPPVTHSVSQVPVGLAPLPASIGAVYAPTTSATTSGGSSALPGEGLAGAAPDTAPIQNLKYPGSDSGVIGSPSDLALHVREPGARPDVTPAAVLALAVIALAVAAHFLYLRMQLELAQARVAARRRRLEGLLE